MSEAITDFLARLDQLREDGIIRHIDAEFPRMIAEIEKDHPETAILAFLSQLAQSSGHTCVPKPAREKEWEHFKSEQVEDLADIFEFAETELASVNAVKPDFFRQISSFVDEFDSIYAKRNQRLEQNLALHFKLRFHPLKKWVYRVEEQESVLKEFLDDSYGSDENSFRLDVSQKEAVVRSLLFGGSVITGGPGTGKTTTARRILEAHLLLWPDDKPLPVIEIAAPTGKAASRLSESLSDTSDRSSLLSEDQHDAIPSESKTIHRLIGLGYHNEPRHNADNPIDADIVIIDEASMIDQQLMNYLLQALNPETKVIFLGDKNQLPSVEAGAVLAQLYPDEQPKVNLIERLSSVSDHFDLNLYQPSKFAVAELEVGHRAGKDSGIANLALQMQQDKKPRIDSGWSDVIVRNYNNQDLVKELREFVAREKEVFSENLNPDDAFKQIKKEQYLSVTNKGLFGAEDINKRVATIWQDEFAVFERGMRIIIKQNDYQNGLFNGEIGVYLRDPDDPEKSYFYFESTGTSQTVRKYLPEQLHKFELAFALSVHKSQGSEYEKVTLIEPKMGNKRHPLFMKELLYTALTRSKGTFIFRGKINNFYEAAVTSNVRYSNLGLRIWGEKG